MANINVHIQSTSNHGLRLVKFLPVLLTLARTRTVEIHSLESNLLDESIRKIDPSSSRFFFLEHVLFHLHRGDNQRCTWM